MDDASNLPDVKLIALTGGACSGKTTFLNCLREMDSLCGYKLLFVPEAATLLSSHGMSFSDGEEMYQRAILGMQLGMEEVYVHYAENLNCNVCIVADRGTLDGAAYCGDETFGKLCDERKTSPAELMEHYDGVLYMVSAAIGAPEHYTTANNETRRETLEEAVVLERRTLECWQAHPNISVIDNEGDKEFEEKLREAMDALMGMLSA